MNDFKLDTTPKISSGFQTPENYFDTFPESLLTHLAVEEPKTLSLWKRNQQWIYGMAAVIVLSISLPIMHTIKPIEKEVSSSDIENYLTYHSTLTEEDLVDLLNTEDIAKIKIDKPIKMTNNEEILMESSEISD
jgi:hypothetical protein